MRQPQSYTTILKREGRFRLLRSPLKKTDVRIWHNCDHYGDEELKKNSTIYEVRYCVYSKENPSQIIWGCTLCGEPSPENLTGLYIMLDWERATREIAETTCIDTGYSAVEFPF